MKLVDIYDSEHLRFSAPYAALSKNSRGRKFPLERIPYRTEYQRDRDRIIHSTAFRRLQHKTQVFANLDIDSDHYRTRLTHTIEVAQISRTIARLLGLNEDLAEAVALAHDLGHTPFGHAGEEALDSLLSAHGGFNHNHQSLRVVDYLERRYPDHFGLNLTYELREAIIKHESVGSRDIDPEFCPDENPLLEGQIVNLADEIAYSGHDVDDGVSSGLLSWELIEDTDYLRPILDQAKKNTGDDSRDLVRFALVRGLVNNMVTDLVDEITRRLRANKIGSVEDIRACPARLIGFSPEQERFNIRLREFLLQRMYRHPRLEEKKQFASRIINFLYRHYSIHSAAIPEEFRLRYPGQTSWRLTADYIAGMTDRFADGEFARLQ